MSKNDQKSAADKGPASDETKTAGQDASAAAAAAVKPADKAPPADKPKPAIAATSEPAPAPAKKPFTGKLSEARIGIAEGKRNIWVIVPELGTPYETVRDNPEFLSHVASRLRPYDRIEVFAEDGSYFAELIVRAAGRQFARLSELRFVALEALRAEADTRFSVIYSGPHLKHTVLRVRDKAVLKNGFDTAEDAHGWLAANVKSLAA